MTSETHHMATHKTAKFEKNCGQKSNRNWEICRMYRIFQHLFYDKRK